MELYRWLSWGSVLLQVGPALWWLRWAEGVKGYTFLYVAMPGLWTFLLGIAVVTAIVWEEARGLGARLIFIGQILGMTLQFRLGMLFIFQTIPVDLQLSALPMISGQILVLSGLLWSLREKRAS